MTKMNKLKLFFLLILLFSISLFAQNKDPNKILDRVKNEFNKIEDYVVEIKVRIDVEFLKIPDSEAKLYFKQPDKIHVESEKFALLPKQGLDFSPLSLISGKYTALYEREDTIKGVLTSVVKIIPLGNESDIILSTFWVDQKRNVIMRMESTKKPIGTFSIDFAYEKYDSFELPSLMEFTFSVDKMMFPKGMNGSMGNEEGNKKDSESKKGKVIIKYKNYEVNQGLPDELFETKVSD